MSIWKAAKVFWTLVADMLKIGVPVRVALLVTVMVVVGWDRAKEAELSPPRLRVMSKVETANELVVQNETHLLVLFVSNSICSKLIS